MDRPASQGAKHVLVSGAELENLPSFGMSAYMNLASGAETAAMLENIKDGKYPTPKQGNGNQLKPPCSGPSRMAPPSTSSRHGQEVQVIIQDDKEYEQQDPDEYGFKFAAATAPISSTVDASQIMETEVNSPQSLGEAARPKLRVKMMTNYMRFRYMSEKCPKKKAGKTRHYEVDDNDKHCLAEVSVDNYTGVGKIVAYCVDSTGKLHPYNLFGEGCHQGVYVYKYKFRPGRTARLQKVSVTTPIAKEYAKNQADQLSYLGQVGIQDVKFCKPDSIQDKQIVYVMFKVILDDHNGEVLSQISTPLQNKKKGKEFRIEDVEPVSCPANIPSNCNPNRYRVMLHVTEETAFPSEIGVKIRERDLNMQVIWEAEPASFTTVKQCVVKFVPPLYKNPDTKEDVEVEICLYDKATKIETEPIKFVYKGSDNVRPEMNLENKAKKRKLTEDFDMSQMSFVPGNVVQRERKTLTALRSRPTSSSSRSSDDSSSDNSLTHLEETQSAASASYMTDPSTQTQTGLTQVTTAGTEDRAVSIREHNSVNGHLPFANYTGNVGHGLNEGQFNSDTSSSQTVHNSARPQSAGFMGDISGISQPANLNQSSVVTSTTSVFGTTTTYQNSSTAMTAKSVNSTRSNMSYQPQQQPGPAQRQASQFMVLSDEDKQTFAQQGVQLPKLGPNQMLALIGGQIYVVNDDTAEQMSDVTPPPATYNPPGFVQNIGQQQVFITQVAPQQPASESDQRQQGLQPNVSQESFQTQTMSNISQTLGNPQYGTTSNSAINVLASQSTAVHQHLQQQQLQQQQQQQQQQVQQVMQQLTQAAAAAGLDINQPEVYQLLIQQALGLQMQTLQQEDQTADANSGMFGSGSDLNDDDVEIDGDQTSKDGENNDTINGQMSQSDGIGDQRNKKLRASSNKERDRFLQNNNIIIQIVPGVEADDSASNIPTFVNEVVIGDESNDSDSYSKVPSEKNVDYVLKNGSFGNDIGSEDEDGL